jgi:hypothetical protein
MIVKLGGGWTKMIISQYSKWIGTMSSLYCSNDASCSTPELITADQDTGMENYWHPLAYSTFASEAHNPNCDEAMRQDHDGSKEATTMGLEIKQLEGKDA